MSIMTRNPDGSLSAPGTYNGRPMGPITAAPPPDMQRAAMLDQLAPPTAGALPRGTPAAAPGMPSTGGASPFARGGTVTQLPGSGTAGKLGNIGVGVGADVAGHLAASAGQTAARQGVDSVASQIGGRAASLGAGAASLGAGAGISLGTDMLANKLRSKEDAPTFGGEFGGYTDDLGRRFQGTGGGVASNAVKYAGYGANPALAGSTMGLSIAAGAAAGAIKGAITKHAKSAYSDFRVEDAANAIKAQYRKELGRDASDDEVKSQLVGQGWDPDGGDRWVGEKNLIGKSGVMDQIRHSPEAADFARTGVPASARAAIVDQLGAGGGASAAGDAAGGASGPAGAAGGAGVGDTSGWDTDGYAAPQYVPKGDYGPAPPGFDAAKWADPNHQTPKYAVTRILNQYGGTPEGVGKAMPELEQAYPGATFNGKDKITIPGLGTIDVVKAAGKGGEGLQWIPDDAGQGGAPATGTPARGATAGPADDGGDLLARLQAEIDRIQNGAPDRHALMAQMGAA